MEPDAAGDNYATGNLQQKKGAAQQQHGAYVTSYPMSRHQQRKSKNSNPGA